MAPDRRSTPRHELSRPRHLFACLLAGATLVLVYAGGLVTSTGSSLAVPDWPLSFGMLFPPMVGGVLFEHSHRMIAGSVGLLTLALAIWTWIQEPRRWVRRLAAIALAAVVLQALLGGLTVLLLLPPAVSVSHAALAQAFLCLVVTLALVTGRDWFATETLPRRAPDSWLRGSSVALVGVVYLQLLLGAVMRHTGAGLAIPDFPLAFGRVVPDLSSAAVGIHFAHRVGAVVVSALLVATVSQVLARHRDEPRLRQPAILLLPLLALQLTLGALIVWTAKAVVPTTTHVAVGAAILATAVVLALRVHRRIDARASEKVEAPVAARRASA